MHFFSIYVTLDWNGLKEMDKKRNCAAAGGGSWRVTFYPSQWEKRRTGKVLSMGYGYILPSLGKL